MPLGKSVFSVKLGAAAYEIELNGSMVRIFYMSRARGRRAIGNASFMLHGQNAVASGNITHVSPRVVQELWEKIEKIFKARHPKVSISGHIVWFAKKGPPVGINPAGPRQKMPSRKRQRHIGRK
ncbi:MAG TPA: hypothetical protein VI977_06650 [archaeon]|nr:hypothetical protein [archaeon]